MAPLGLLPMRSLPILFAAALLAAVAAAPAQAGPLPGAKTARDRAAWRAILHWPKSCEQGWQTGSHPPVAGVDLWPRSGGERLVAVTCFLGAYQGTTRFYLLDTSRRATSLAFHVYYDPGSGKPTPIREQEILGVPVFTPRTGSLSVFDKARGPGDCGIYSTFRLSGARFVPVETHARTRCDGKPPYDPKRWPKLPLLGP
jgi:Protein of unknown function (DUF1176)